MCPGSTPGRTGVDFGARALVRAEEVMDEAMKKTKELRFLAPGAHWAAGRRRAPHRGRVD